MSHNPSSDTTSQEQTPLFSPQPVHRRTSSSYGSKFSNPKLKNEDIEPPEPVKTPGFDSPSKPFLKRSSTSFYQSELENVNRRPSLENANSASDAYHLQQRRQSEGPDVFDTTSVEKLNINEKISPQSTANIGGGPERHSGLLNHIPGPEGEIDQNYTFDIQQQAPGEFDKSKTDNEEDLVNNVNQFKRRFSWWSKE